MRHKKHIILAVIAFLSIAIVAVSLSAVYQFRLFQSTPLDPGAGSVYFAIKPGQNLKSIAHNLKSNNIISNDILFIWLGKLKNADKKLQAGEYLLSASHSPARILDTLLKGKVKLNKITFPEGLSIKETAMRLEKANFCSAEQFITLCHDPVFIKDLGIASQSLEGFLFPDTYFFPNQTACRTIIETMITRFNQVFKPEWEKRAKKLNLSVFEIVTLASIIEKETGDASERPIISSVFHNRLQKRMRLESDPTVIYGIKDFDGNIKRKHLRAYTPYNTYRIKGLPIGPIANPGALSIEAALYPADTDYLFFVSKKDTTHYFSKTFEEHNRAVRKYQLNKK